MNKLKKGDEVIVITGKDKGKTGAILAMIDDGRKVLVSGINLVKKHVKANPNSGERGGIIPKEKPLDRSNVMIYDAASKKGSRVGVRALKDGKKVRYFKSSDQLIDAKE